MSDCAEAASPAAPYVSSVAAPWKACAFTRDSQPKGGSPYGRRETPPLRSPAEDPARRGARDSSGTDFARPRAARWRPRASRPPSRAPRRWERRLSVARNLRRKALKRWDSRPGWRQRRGANIRSILRGSAIRRWQGRATTVPGERVDRKIRCKSLKRLNPRPEFRRSPKPRPAVMRRESRSAYSRLASPRATARRLALR